MSKSYLNFACIYKFITYILQVSNIMQNGMYVVDKVSNLSLAEMRTVDDPSESILDPRASLWLMKAEPSKLQGTNYMTPYAAVSVISTAEGGSGCFQLKVTLHFVD